MELELSGLEDKVMQLAALCRELRAENRVLRQDLLIAQQEQLHLTNKLAGTKEKVAAILAKLPEDVL
jgi:cell division protein ZapB